MSLAASQLTGSSRRASWQPSGNGRAQQSTGSFITQSWLLVCLVASLLVQPSSAFLWVPKKRFSYEGLIHTGSLGLDGPLTVVALVDFNADQYVDAITLDRDQTRVDVRLWQHDLFAFAPSPYASVSAPVGKSIVNVVAADFNYDGKPDLLLMLQSDPETGKRDSELEMQLWLGVPGGGFETSPVKVPSSIVPQPLTFDATGDMQADLLGHRFGAASSADNASAEQSSSFDLWRNTFLEGNGSVAFELETAPFSTQADGKPAPKCQLANPHSSAFIDLNGDCLADLFLVCSSETFWSTSLSYQIWTATKPSTSKQDKTRPSFVLSKSGPLPQGTGALSFADMNRDGTIDIVFPTCDGSSGECFINIAHNRQVPLCAQRNQGGWFGVGPGGPGKSSAGGQAVAGNPASSSSAKGTSQRAFSARAGDEEEGVGGSSGLSCRQADRLCTADPDFSFDFTLSDSNADLTRIPISSLTDGLAKRLVLSDQLLKPSAPVPISLGDHNKDGFPDAVILVEPVKGRRGETRTLLLRNVPCRMSGDPMPGCPQDPKLREGRRTFEVVTQGAEVLDRVTDVRRASFFDVDEDGSLDLILQRDSQRGSSSRTISFVQNNFFHDAFFLKALTLNGACLRDCEPAAPDLPKFKPWGVNYGGASFKFTVLDTNGLRRAQQVGQLPQNTYRVLHTPYSYFGLGRTNNYVESLYVGTTRRQREHFSVLEGIIPNSQIVIAPWQGGAEAAERGEDGDPSMWHKELYLTPGDWIPVVTVVLVTVILILSACVLFMHLNERREDEREKRRAVHAINFDAL